MSSVRKWLASARFLVIALVAVGIVSLLVVGLGAQRAMLRSSSEDNRATNIHLEALSTANGLQASVDSLTIDLRAYLRGTPGATMGSVRADFEDSAGRLRSLQALPMNARDRVLLDRLDALLARQSSLLSKAASSRGAAERDTIRTEQSTLEADWRRAIQAFFRQQDADIVALHVGELDVQRRLRWAVFGAMLVSLLLMSSLAALVVRRVTQPLQSLEACAERMASGDYDIRVPPIATSEYATLGATFNTMATRIAATLAELRGANAELKAADRYKDEFLAIVSHELRTPLNLITGFTSILEDELDGPLNEQQRARVHDVMKSADRMLKLVENLIEMAAIQTDHLTLEPGPTPYDLLVESVYEQAKPLADEKHLTLDVFTNVPGEPCLDGVHTAKALANLVDNAIKFTPSGGRVSIRSWVQDGQILTRVADTGIGIPKAVQPKLFQPFWQQDMTSTRQAGGVGIGLGIVKAIVEGQGGHVHVTSEEGQGATFGYDLPLTYVCQEMPQPTPHHR
ncbi:MAG TPA: HAMP domain-containing sensor histidine kinase [Oscillatoriaceae cyanobacterium]